MKAAVYCGTRGVYRDMAAACRSLLLHADVERVFFCIEDPTFPEALPDCVTCIDVSGQKFFPPEGPNYRQKWTWMVLMRTALAKVLPAELDTILSLDTDTVVLRDVSGLWDIPLGDSYLAAAREPAKSAGRPLYVNAGVVLYNLRQLRADGMDDRLIAELNLRRHPFTDQDALNLLCQGRIREIPSEYNACPWTEPCRDPRILHFAAIEDWRDHPLVRQVRALAWQEVLARRGGGTE